MITEKEHTAELQRMNIIFNKELGVWEAWDESSTLVICSSPYPDVAVNGHLWYCENILDRKTNV